MKIVSVSTSFPHPENSVSGIFVYNLMAAISVNHNVVVITPSYKGVKGGSDIPNLTVVACRYAPKSLERLAHSPGGIPAAIKSNVFSGLCLLFSMMMALVWNTFRQGLSADIIHANWSVGGFVALPLKLYGKKIVVTLRGDDIARAQANKVSRVLLGFLVRISDQVIAVSQEMHQWLIMQYKQSEKIIYIPNGVDELFASVGRNRVYSDKYQPLKFIYVGSLIPRKNVGFILDGLSKLPSTVAWTLLIVGDGVERSSLENKCQALNISERVNFVGVASPEAVAACLNCSDIFLFSSRAEGKPNVLMEAMAAGLVIVAPRISGVNELIEHTTSGLLYSTDDLDGFTANLNYLNDNRHLIGSIANRAYHSFEKEYGPWGKAANNYIAVFERL